MTAQLLYTQTDFDYTVHGIVRKNSQGLQVLTSLNSNQLHFYFGDVTDSLFMLKVIGDIKPDEILNFAAQSHVKHSFDTPLSTFTTITLGVWNICESVRLLGL